MSEQQQKPLTNNEIICIYMYTHQVRIAITT